MEDIREELLELKDYMVKSEHWRVDWLLNRIDGIARQLDYYENRDFYHREYND
jgi:hypothetical protein